MKVIARATRHTCFMLPVLLAVLLMSPLQGNDLAPDYSWLYPETFFGGDDGTHQSDIVLNEVRHEREPSPLVNNLAFSTGCADVLTNLNTTGIVPDPTIAYDAMGSPFGCGTETMYPSPIVTAEQSGQFATAFCPGAPSFRGLDESFQVVVGGNLIVPSTGGAEIEGRAAIGGNMVVDRNYGIAESGGGTYVIGAAGDAVGVGGTVSGTGPLSLGFNNLAGTYNIVSGGTNTTTLNNGNATQNSPGGLPLDVPAFMGEVTCLSMGLAAATATGSFDAGGSNFFLGSDNPTLEILTVDGADLNPAISQNSGYADVGLGATLVVNVSGTTVDLNYTVNAGRVDEPMFVPFGGGPLIYNVIWNFYEATSINLMTDFHGTIIAPLADVDIQRNFNGRLYIGGNLTHSGAGSEIHNYPFTGDVSAFCTAACTITADALANIACTGTDAITLDLTPTGTDVSATYTVSVAGGAATAITPTSGTYDVATSFTLNDNSAGGGDVTVTITDASGCTRDVVVTDPGACTGSGSFCSDLTNPLLAATCVVNGNPTDATTNTQDAVVRFDNNASGSSKIGDFGEVGSTWALAYDYNSDQLFTASVLRRHIGLGPGGTANGLGAIYVSATASATAGTPTLFYDLAAHVAVGTVSDNATRGLTTLIAPSYDPAVFDLIGKAGLGDIDVSDDGSQLYVVNLFDKLVYLINTATPAAPPTALPAYPDPGCTNGESRPWALKLHNGRLYLGVICSAESSGTAANLEAFVYAYDGNAWTEVLNFPLDYTRQDVYPGLGGDWNPWASTFSDLTGANGFFSYPTPVFSDIEFLDDGSMVLGFLDRTTFQVGYDDFSTDDTTPDTDLYGAVSGGDVLRASADGDGTFTIESNGAATDASFGPSAGAGTSSGPGDGEFYFGDQLIEPGESHLETSTGGLAVLPGSGEVIVSVIDPQQDPSPSQDNLETGGIHWLSNTTGNFTKALRLYSGRGFDGLLGKSGGIGDVEILCGTECQIMITSATPSSCDMTTGEYTLDVVVTYSNEQVGGLTITTDNGASQTFFVDGTGSETLTLTDLTSDGVANITVTATWDNDNTCTISNQMYTAPDACEVSNMLYSLGSTIFEDGNNNGMQDAGENGIGLVPVELYDATNTLIDIGPDGILGTADDDMGMPYLADASGNYFFQNLPASMYQVQISATAFGGGQPLETINISSTPTDTNDNEEDNDDNGSQAGGAGTVIVSPVITLGEADGEPTGADESGQGGTADNDDDALGDMTVDFGLFAPVSLGDTTFVDLDENGLQDAGEPELAGVTVTLFDSASGMQVTTDAEGNAITGTTMTNAMGFYEFTNLPPGNYYVVFDLSTVPGNEFLQFTSTAGGNEADDSDADPTTGQTENTGDIASGERYPDLDAGVICNVSVTVNDPFMICSTGLIDLTQEASISPDNVADFGGTWTSSGTGTFDDGAGEFGVATSYTPSQADINLGSVTLTLTTDDPSMPPFNATACGPVASSVTIMILKVDCGSFFWDGTND